MPKSIPLTRKFVISSPFTVTLPCTGRSACIGRHAEITSVPRATSCVSTTRASRPIQRTAGGQFSTGCQPSPRYSSSRRPMFNPSGGVDHGTDIEELIMSGCGFIALSTLGRAPESAAATRH